MYKCGDNIGKGWLNVIDSLRAQEAAEQRRLA